MYTIFILYPWTSKVSLKVAREEHQKQEQLHLQDREQLTESLHEKDLQYQELLRDTKMRHAEDMLQASESFEERLRETEKRYTTRFAALRTELHLRLKTEVGIELTSWQPNNILHKRHSLVKCITLHNIELDDID